MHNYDFITPFILYENCYFYFSIYNLIGVKQQLKMNCFYLLKI